MATVSTRSEGSASKKAVTTTVSTKAPSVKEPVSAEKSVAKKQVSSVEAPSKKQSVVRPEVSKSEEKKVSASPMRQQSNKPTSSHVSKGHSTNVPPKEEPISIDVKMPSLQQMLEAGAHFGHKVSRWNPAMKPYIFDVRAGMHVIDLTKTLGMLEDAVNALARVARKGNILLVGTKGQAATIIKNAGIDHGAFFISRRWPGGLLTNFKTVHRSVRRLMELEENLAYGRGYETKRERLVLERERERLSVLYEGILFMDSLPSAIVVVDTKVEKNAIKEAKKKGIPVFAIVDTNCDPRLVEYPIPGNEDAIKSIDLFIGILVQAFTSTNTSARLIGQRNDFRTRVELISRERETEEERKRKEREIEVARLKAMKEGKTVDMPNQEEARTGESKVVRVVRQEEQTEQQSQRTTVRVSQESRSTPTRSQKPATKVASPKKETVKKNVTKKKTIKKTAVKK